jgi:hypothetical protein
MLVGAVGMLGLHSTGQKMNGDALRMTRATAIAQDLLNQISLWSYTDPRLANTNAANDADVGDTAFAFESDPPPFDHGEVDLGAGWTGIPTADIQAGGYQRYWNVASLATDDTNANGVPDAMRIAVIVRWPWGSGWRRIVLMAVKANPAESQ